MLVRLYTVVCSPRAPFLAPPMWQCVATEWLRVAKRQLPSFAPTARTTNGQSELLQAATQASSDAVLSRRKEMWSCPPCVSKLWRRPADAGASFRRGYGEQRVCSSFTQPFQITRLSSSAGLGTGATAAVSVTLHAHAHTHIAHVVSVNVHGVLNEHARNTSNSQTNIEHYVKLTV